MEEALKQAIEEQKNNDTLIAEYRELHKTAKGTKRATEKTGNQAMAQWAKQEIAKAKEELRHLQPGATLPIAGKVTPDQYLFLVQLATQRGMSLAETLCYVIGMAMGVVAPDPGEGVRA